MKKRIISAMCTMTMLLGNVAPCIPVSAAKTVSDGYLVEESETPLRLHYDEEAPYGNEGTADSSGITASDGWERWSLPIGNGYFGANVFGRTETERIQITEKTLSNPYRINDAEGNQQTIGGLNNFSETYIDFGHTNSKVTAYERYLDLKTAISGVTYGYNGVTYTREYFTSYPDKALVIRLDASEEGALNFTLRPTVPWQQEYAAFEGDGASKTGTVVSTVENGIGQITLSGKMGYYDVDFAGLYRVVTDSGVVTATECVNEYGNVDGTITVTGAKSAYIYVTLGTDYELTSEIFTAAEKEKPTFYTDLSYTMEKVGAELAAIETQLEGKSFEEGYAILKNNHLADYTEMFGRVSVDLGDAEDAEVTTDELLNRYKNGQYSNYLEMLYFQYGRYLLIASSRSGALPANLQGVWNRYNYSPWGSGIWHNVNVQMNYWPAFVTNVAETFESYVEFNAAYMPKLEQAATTNVQKYNPDALGEDGGNGWCVGVGSHAFSIGGDRSAGNLGFTTQLFWEYYRYTQDKTLLENVVFPILVSAARFIVKMVEEDENGNYLIAYCDSPEQHVDGVWYYTSGTTYAQSFAYQNNYNALLAAKELGIDLSDSELLNSEELCVFKKVMEQLDKYDPIIVGLSGQVKEFREEEYYGDLGEYTHRHISQLVGLYPGNIINSTTPAWLDAAKVTLTERGDKATGWGIAHRLNLWARTKDGDRTYQVLNALLTTSTATNLWDLHPPFQIDGNLGGTSGIAEMLLQSHEGYIAPLAALPEAWSDGSYTGLVARGNFEISAAWKNGVATTFNITSTVGGDASVYYGGITSAKVVRVSDGKVIDYKVDGTDLITFATEVGETYVISGFKVSEKLSAPEGFTAERSGLGNVTLTWQPVEGAVGYRVYTAIESQPDYTPLAFTAANGYIYVPSADNVNARTTFKVVAINANGVEGKTALCYQNPVDINATVEKYEANVFEGGELQVVLKTSENSRTYKLWKKAAGETEYTLVTESLYPVIITNGYNENDTYAVTVVSKYLNVESEPIVLDRIMKAESGGSLSGYFQANVLSGNKFVANTGATALVHDVNYGYAKLTDGIYNKDANGNINGTLGRFATKDVANAVMDGTVTLPQTYLLSEMRIYDFTGSGSTRIGDKVDVYANTMKGWELVYSIEGRSNIVNARIADGSTTTGAMGLYYLPIDLTGVQCDALRVVCTNTTGTKGTTLYEITCSGAPIDSGYEYTDSVLVGKTPSSLTDSGAISDYPASRMTDGSYDPKLGRYALLGKENNYFTAEYTLSGDEVLTELRIYDFAESAESVSRASEVTVELYRNGQWVKYMDGKALLTPSKAQKDEHNRKYTPIPLNGDSAEKIRITARNTVSTLGVTIYELTLCGYSKPVPEAENENIFAGSSFIPAAGTQVWGNAYGYQTITDGLYGIDENGNKNIHLGRFSSKDGTDACLDGTVYLDGIYSLDQLQIIDYEKACRIGDKIEIHTYYAGEWSLVYSIEGKTNVINARAINSSNLYYLPVSLNGVKAEAVRVYIGNKTTDKAITLWEITCSGSRVNEYGSTNAIANSTTATVTKTAYESTSNVLGDKTFVMNSGATAVVGVNYNYAKLTDGLYGYDESGNRNIHLGRFSTKSGTPQLFDGTVNLGEAYELGEMRIYDYGWNTVTRIGTSVKVYASINGEWAEVYSIEGKTNILKARKTDANIYNYYYLPIDLTGITATALRVVIEDTEATDGITLWEITCAGTKVSGELKKDTTTAKLTANDIASVTDGNKDTVLTAVDGALSYSAEFDLGGTYTLSTLSVRLNGNGNKNISVALYSDGGWYTMIKNVKQEGEYVRIPLYGLSASKIKITVGDGESFAGVLSEIYCTIGSAAGDRKPLLDAYSTLAVIKNGDEAYNAQIAKFNNYLTAFTVSDELVAKYAEEINAYSATLLNGTHTAHELVNYEAKAATCDTVGHYAYTACKNCDLTTYSESPVLGHKYSTEVIAPTCTKNGHTAYTCSACGNSYTANETSATGHAYDDEYDADCNNCGEVREVEKPVTVIDSGICGENATWTLTSDGVLTVSGEGAMSDYSTTVSAPWYSHTMSINTVVIEAGITHVGEYAFRSCTAITSLNIAEGVLTIGYYAFNQCSMLTSVTIPDSVTFIDSYAFANCHNLTELTIGKGVETISNYAFRYCGKLTTVTIPASVNSIRYGAFYRCSALTQVIFENPEGWWYATGTDATEGTEIYSAILADTATAATYLTNTYYNRYWFRTEKADEPVTEVANGKCGVNTTWVLTSDGVLTISGNGDTEDYLVSITTEQPYRAYQNQITKVVIEDGVTSIGRGAFYGFTNITEVVFPESLIAIHEYAFFGCSGIKTIDIPANTFYIGMYAFRKSGLTEMTFANAAGWTFADGTALDVTNVKAFTTEFTYKQTCIRTVYEDGEVIANGVFGNKDQFTWTLTSTGVLTVSGKGNMPKFNVNTTPWYGYRGAIRSVVIEEGITSVGRCSFHTCRAITNITLPESLETIAEYAFYNCQFLTEAAIPANVIRIEIYAFRKCFALKNVEFAINYGWSANGEKISATELNSNAADMLTLVNYTKIWTRDINAEEEVLDPNYVTGGACNTTVKWALTYIDDTKTKMKLTISGTGAMPKFETAGTPWYAYLDNIVEVEVCEGITEIGRCSFYGLKFVKEVTISNTVIAINDHAFNGCFSLKTIEIPASVTFIAETAFTKTGLSEIPTV